MLVQNEGALSSLPFIPKEVPGFRMYSNAEPI
jgi:hypothetical protein